MIFVKEILLIKNNSNFGFSGATYIQAKLAQI